MHFLPVDAPKASALTTCPTVWMPPSAVTGTPKRRAYSATLYTAVPCGRPHAITGNHKFIIIIIIISCSLYMYFLLYNN